MKHCYAAAPEFHIGQKVAYMDHHKRWQCGRVLAIEAKWHDYGRDNGSTVVKPWISYTVEHPTYRNRVMYCSREHYHMKEVSE